MGSDYFYSLDFKPNYHGLTEWLKEKKLLDQARTTSDDISHVLVAKMDSSYFEDQEKIKKDVENSGDSLDITDKKQIGLLLNSMSSDPSYEYKAVFYYNSGNYSEMMFFDEEHASEFVKGHFK